MQRTRLNVPARLGQIAEAQDGYFTRAQATAASIGDFELDRAIEYGQLRRLDHGVYRIVGAGTDPHETLRATWLRLTPKASPRERTYKPKVWVARRSAAIVHGFGDFIADVPEFIATRRHQARTDAAIAVRSRGLNRSDWTVIDGFAVTTVVRTFTDLIAARHDGGHIGRYSADAVAAGATTIDALQKAAGAGVDVAAVIAMADK